MRRLGCVLTLLVLSLGGRTLAEENQFGDYHLGPQDKLEIRVHDIRTGTGEAHQWAAFDGEFIVDAKGNVSLPLIGEVLAGGGTTAELASALAARVQAKVGLAQLPSAAVQVVKYRPFYILGAVDKPGEYEFRPGLTVLQAVSIAGGLQRPRDPDLIGFQRDAILQRGDLRTLAAEQQGLKIRQSRLTAEIADADTITFPSEARASEARLDVARAMREETLLFETRRNAVKTQVVALGNARVLLLKELASLDAKDEALARQIDLIRKELLQITNLVAKGLAVAPRQSEIERSVAAYESNRIDAQIGRLRVQQDLSKAEREILDLQAKRRNDALVEASDVRGKIAIISERIDSATKLVYQAEVRSPGTVTNGEGAMQTSYTLTRRTGGETETRSVSDSEMVDPGDVVRATIPNLTPPLANSSPPKIAAER